MPRHQIRYSTKHLQDLCFVKVLEEFDLYSPEQLSFLPPVPRKKLLLHSPVVLICHLENTCAFNDIDAEVFWEDLLKKHMEWEGTYFDSYARLNTYQAAYSSLASREKYFTYLTTMIFSGDRFSGHFQRSYNFDGNGEQICFANSIPDNQSFPDDIVNYLVAYRKPPVVHEVVKTKMRTKSSKHRDHDDEDYYNPLSTRDVLGLKCGGHYKDSTKHQHVHSRFSQYILEENHCRLSDEDAVSLMMTQCSFQPRSVYVHEIEGMQWIWDHDTLQHLLIKFFSKLEFLSIIFRSRGLDMDSYIPIDKDPGTEDLQLVLNACFKSSSLTSIDICGPVENHKGGLILHSTLAANPCFCITTLKVLGNPDGSPYDATKYVEALATIVASHRNLSNLELGVHLGPETSADSFSYLYTSLIDFVQRPEFCKLTLSGVFPFTARLLIVLDSFLKTPCSQPQQLHLKPTRPCNPKLELPIRDIPVGDKAPSGAIEYKSLCIQQYSEVTPDFCEWLFSHQPLVLKAFEFGADLTTVTSLVDSDGEEYCQYHPYQAATPVHVLSDNGLFRTKELSLIASLEYGLYNPYLRKIVRQQQLTKLSIAKPSTLTSDSSGRLASDDDCSISDVADILSHQQETLMELKISQFKVTIESPADMKYFGNALFSLKRFEEFTLDMSVAWKEDDAESIETLYSTWLKHHCKKPKLIHLGGLPCRFDLTDELSRKIETMGFIRCL